jgi:hypothetical protein
MQNFSRKNLTYTVSLYKYISASSKKSFNHLEVVWSILNCFIFHFLFLVNDPRPGICSAFGMCVISTGDVLVFGGIIDSIFSSQFWLLKFYDENNNRNNKTKSSNENNDKGKTINKNEMNGNSSKTVDLRGRWVDLRLPNLLSDEQIATNEHIALVLANNNQIMMEVNNQENGDDDDNEENDEDIDNENPNLNQNQNHTINFQNTSISSHAHTIRPPTSLLPLPRIRGETPPGRWGHTLIYYKHYIVLYGGSRPGCSFGDLWVASEKEILGERVFVRYPL